LLACAILAGACLQGPEASRSSEPASERADHVGAAPEANVYVGGSYGAADFPFMVERKWDGKDKAGGWQRSFKLFEFVLRDIPSGLVSYSWSCPLDISMAVHSEVEGDISPKRAALVTAEVANKAVPALATSRTDWKGQGALFCVALKDM